MKQVKIADTTLSSNNRTLSFKEKLEIARKLERLCVDTIEISSITNVKPDTLFVRTISSFVKNSTISVGAGASLDSIKLAADSLSACKKKRIRIELPVSAVNMEYSMHKKPAKMLEYIKECFTLAKTLCEDVEFVAFDATRAEKEFLDKAIMTAVDSGATLVTLCDSACRLLPDDFSDFVKSIKEKVNIEIGVLCDNKNSLACAAGIMSVTNSGAAYVKTDAEGTITPLGEFCNMINSCKENYSLSCNVKFTELNRIVNQISWILSSEKTQSNITVSTDINKEDFVLSLSDTKETIKSFVEKLGYDLSDEDLDKVYEEFLHASEKKHIGAKELDAIIASTALQVPSTYKLDSYVINSGNIITTSAQITLEKDGEKLSGISVGDGPIDASFLALDQIIGRHFELDDFQISAITRGKEAMGSALVRLRDGGKLYSGTGISTDIIGASIRAYLSAVNKIVYEED